MLARYLACATTLSLLAACVGCGGGDDFRAPPAVEDAQTEASPSDASLANDAKEGGFDAAKTDADGGTQPNGAACTEQTASSCESGICADGVCCSAPCEGCNACNLQGKVGTCSPVPKTQDPHDACVTAPPCSGSCNGSGACEFPSAVPCGTAECDENTPGILNVPACDGTGKCSTTPTDCAPYLCDPATRACMTACSASGGCTPDAFCDQTACVAKHPNGSVCSNATECANGNCVDGYCCADACTATCMSCSVFGHEGSCWPDPKGTDPDNQCPGAGVCKGTCGGAGTCEFPGTSTNCDTASCDTATNTQHDFQCNGAGACVDVPAACGLYACSGADCATQCSGDAQCANTAYCSGVACTTKKNNGETCLSPNQCSSGNCVDTSVGKRCCMSACGAPNDCATGQCSCSGITCSSGHYCVQWFRDKDGDGFGNAADAKSACDNQPPLGYVSNSSDCYDENANAKPGQTQYFEVSRGDGSFDYDCDGQPTKYYYDAIQPSTSVCTDCKYNTGCYPCGWAGLVKASYGVACNTAPCSIKFDRGFKGSVDCGSPSVLYRCNPDPSGCDPTMVSEPNTKQKCR